MATEVLAVGVDFSFAPVLDLNKGVSSVIGDRAFHRDQDSDCFQYCRDAGSRDGGHW